VVPVFAADHVNLLLERDEQGKGNWTFRDEAGTVDVHQLTINHGSLRVLERERGTDFSVAAQSGVQAPGEARAPLIISGSGRFRNAPVAINGVVESPLELAHEERPYRVDVRAKAGTTQAHVRGELIAPLQLSGYDLETEISGRNLGDSTRCSAWRCPTRRRTASTGTCTTSTTSGCSADSTARSARATSPATCRSRSARALDAEGGPRFAPPRAGRPLRLHRRRAGRQGRGRAGEPGRVLPDARYDLPRLRAMDADVKVHADTVTGAPRARAGPAHPDRDEGRRDRRGALRLRAGRRVGAGAASATTRARSRSGPSSISRRATWTCR
jgi:hypothetical protein